jgi:hypothetical protein
MDVDLDNRDGGWANAGSDFRVERARGDCDMASGSLPLTTILLWCWRKY